MKRTLLSMAIGAMFLSATVVGLQNASLQERNEETLSVDVDLVNVLFTVTDKKGKSIRDLKRESFRVYEDGKLQTITNFSADADLPLTIALLIDTSGSVRDRLRFEQEAAIEFFHSTLIRDKDQALIISFDSAIDLVEDYSDDPHRLAQSMRRIRAGGATALYDAVYVAATEKLAGQNGRRVIVLISDGDDNSSRLSMPAALEAAQRHDVAVFAISTNSKGLGGEKNKHGDGMLTKFAQETGGKAFFPPKMQDLASSFRDITGELRTQYTLAYRPTNFAHSGGFRRIRIDTSDKRNIVRSRTGYYRASPKPSSD